MKPVKRALGVTSTVAFTSMVDALEADAAALRDGLPGHEDGELDIRETAVWETSDEGRAALDRAKQRTRDAVELAHAAGRRGAGWIDDQ